MKNSFLAILGSAIVCASLIGSGYVFHQQQSVRTSVAAQTEDGLERVSSGVELVAILFASSTCPASNDPELPLALSVIRKSLRRSLSDSGRALIWAAASLDLSPRSGLAFLKRFGDFDEVSAGGSWLNSDALHLIVRDLPGPLQTPQLVLLERRVRAGRSSLTVATDRIVARYVGADAIKQLSKR
jgi:hypothetical protein